MCFIYFDQLTNGAKPKEYIPCSICLMEMKINMIFSNVLIF